MKVGDMIYFSGRYYANQPSTKDKANWRWVVDARGRSGIITDICELTQKVHVLSKGQKIMIMLNESRGWGIESTMIQVISCV